MRKLIVVIIIMCSFSFSKAQIKWEKIVSEKSKISFSLPGKPYIQNKEMNDIQTEVFSFRDASTVFGIVASDFSSKNFNFNNSDYTEFYEQMKASSLRHTSKLVVEHAIPYQQMLGKEIVYTEMIGKKEYTYYKRFFFRNHYIYQVVIGGPSRIKQVLLDKKRLFFNSVVFL